MQQQQSHNARGIFTICNINRSINAKELEAGCTEQTSSKFVFCTGSKLLCNQQYKWSDNAQTDATMVPKAQAITFMCKINPSGICAILLPAAIARKFLLSLSTSTCQLHKEILPLFTNIRCFGYFNMDNIQTEMSEQTH